MDNHSKKQQKTDSRTEIEDSERTKIPDPLLENTSILDPVNVKKKLSIRHLMLLLKSLIRCYSKR